MWSLLDAGTRCRDFPSDFICFAATAFTTVCTSFMFFVYFIAIQKVRYFVGFYTSLFVEYLQYHESEASLSRSDLTNETHQHSHALYWVTSPFILVLLLLSYS